jgi:imidazolonepropionase-like amidohydrolase
LSDDTVFGGEMRLVLLNCGLVDCTGRAPLDRGAIVIDDGKIAAIGPGTEVYPVERKEEGDHVVDLRGCYVLPGLMNMHVHLSLTYPLDGPPPPDWETTLPWRCAKTARDALEAGVTLIRTTGEARHVDIGLKKAIESRLAVGSRLICAGQGITPIGGHGSDSEWCVEASGPEEFRRKAREQLRAGADHIKLLITQGIAHAPDLRGKPLVTLAEVQAAVEVAHHADKRVCAHIGGPEGAKLAMQAGVDCLEHCYTLDDQAVAMFGERETYLVPTLGVNHAQEFFREQGWPEKRLQQMTEDGNLHRASFLRAVRAGAKPAVGTDMLPTDRPNLPGFPIATVREIELMVQAGLSEMEALMAGTKNTAELCQVADRLGTLQVGKLADLIAVEGNPAANIEALRKMRLVIKDGEIVRHTWDPC